MDSALGKYNIFLSVSPFLQEDSSERFRYRCRVYSHPAAPLGAYLLAKRLGKPFVLEVRDVWPETRSCMG